MNKRPIQLQQMFFLSLKNKYMKRTFILSTATLVIIAIFITSCRPSKVWATNEKKPAYDYRNDPQPEPERLYRSAGLIIRPTPGFRMSQRSDGRYYHRSSQGLLYWKGYDNRFYLDRNYFERIYYNKWEYKEWKRYSRQSYKR